MHFFIYGFVIVVAFEVVKLQPRWKFSEKGWGRNVGECSGVVVLVPVVSGLSKIRTVEKSPLGCAVNLASVCLVTVSCHEFVGLRMLYKS